MSVWTWVLIGLCVAGAVLAVAPVLTVLLQAKKLRARMLEIQNSRLFMTLESMQIQTARLARLNAQAAPLAGRISAAIAAIKESGAKSGLAPARASVEEAGAELQALARDLR